MRPETRTVVVPLVPFWVTPPVDDVHVALYEVIGEPFAAPAVTATSTLDVAPETV